jgi:hypothetical protein
VRETNSDTDSPGDARKILFEILEATHEVSENTLAWPVGAKKSMLRAKVRIGLLFRDKTNGLGKLREGHIAV